MSALTRQQRIAALRDTIANIERKPALAEAFAPEQQASREGFPILPAGLTQEIFTDERRHAGAVLGFALAQANTLFNQKRRAVIYLQLASEAQDMGLPYAPGLVSFGFDPDRLTLVRTANITELLWAAEEALACQAVAAVIADIAGQPKSLNFTASRRLNLRAASAGTSILLLRYGQWREASAAQLRWRLTPSLSAETPFDIRAPGQSRWRVQLEKGTASHLTHEEWLLSWTDDGFAKFDTRPHPDKPAQPAALSRPVFARLGDRLLQTA